MSQVLDDAAFKQMAPRRKRRPQKPVNTTLVWESEFVSLFYHAKVSYCLSLMFQSQYGMTGSRS